MKTFTLKHITVTFFLMSSIIWTVCQVFHYPQCLHCLLYKTETSSQSFEQDCSQLKDNTNWNVTELSQWKFVVCRRLDRYRDIIIILKNYCLRFWLAAWIFVSFLFHIQSVNNSHAISLSSGWNTVRTCCGLS